MDCLQEQQNRRYFQFLLIFCGFILLCALIGSWLYLQQSRQLLLQQQLHMTSALLEQEVDPIVIAQSLHSRESSTAGNALLQQLGLTEQSAFSSFPCLQRPFFIFLLFSFFTALCCCGLLLYCSIRFLEARERTYRQAASILTALAGGDFSQHLPHGQSGALYQLLGAADQLAMALQAKIEQEHRQKLFLQRTISDISHQLKTPLAALSMYNEIMAAETGNAAAIQTFTEKSAQSIQRMEQLIQTLLKLMQLDAGTILFEKQRCTVSELAAQAAAQHWTRAQQEQKQLLLSGDATESVLCDFHWTSEALSNLIKNALDHTAAGGVIQIHWQRTPVLLRITVQDNGTGIAEEDIHHIFKRFYRSKQSCRQEGVGLGLPLAKAIIEGQGGSLSVQSALGLGTIFTLTL